MEKLLAVVLIELHDSLLASTVVKHHALDYQREVTFGVGLAQAGPGFAIFCVAYLPWVENQEKLRQHSFFIHVIRIKCKNIRILITVGLVLR
jgi:hypothetical protein